MFGLFKSQQSYSVHEMPDPPADRDERAERLRFVRDGFSFFAFLVPPVWMLVNRLWLVLICYVLVASALYLALDAARVPAHWHGYATLALSLIIGFEADSLIRWTLDRRSWNFVGSVSGENFDECERRFFEKWINDVGIINPSNLDAPGAYAAASVPSAGRPHEGDVMPPKRGWQTAGAWTSWKRS